MKFDRIFGRFLAVGCIASHLKPAMKDRQRYRIVPGGGKMRHANAAQASTWMARCSRPMMRMMTWYTFRFSALASASAKHRSRNRRGAPRLSQASRAPISVAAERGRQHGEH